MKFVMWVWTTVVSIENPLEVATGRENPVNGMSLQNKEQSSSMVGRRDVQGVQETLNTLIYRIKSIIPHTDTYI